MKIIKFENIQSSDIYNKARVIKEMSLSNFNDRLKIVEAANYSQETMKEWFNAIGIKYDNLKLTKSNVIYTINNEELTLTELSHGERYLLFLKACKVTNDLVIAESLLEILGYRLRKVLYEQLADYENLIVVTLNAYPPEYILKYKVGRI